MVVDIGWWHIGRWAGGGLVACFVRFFVMRGKGAAFFPACFVMQVFFVGLSGWSAGRAAFLFGGWRQGAAQFFVCRVAGAALFFV